MALSGMAKIAVPVLLVYLLASWIIAMAGLASVTDKINSGYTVSLQWFLLFWHLLLIIGLPLLAVSGMLRKMSTAMVSYLTTISTLYLYFAYQAYVQVRGNAAEFVLGDNDIDTRLNTWIAGLCLLFIGNFIAILFLSLDAEADKEIISAPNTKAGPAGPGMPVSQPMPAPEVV